MWPQPLREGVERVAVPNSSLHPERQMPVGQRAHISVSNEHVKRRCDTAATVRVKRPNATWNAPIDASNKQKPCLPTLALQYPQQRVTSAGLCRDGAMTPPLNLAGRIVRCSTQQPAPPQRCAKGVEGHQLSQSNRRPSLQQATGLLKPPAPLRLLLQAMATAVACHC